MTRKKKADMELLNLLAIYGARDSAVADKRGRGMFLGLLTRIQHGLYPALPL